MLSFATIPAALDRLAEIVATGPVAVEMLDRMILDLAAAEPALCRSTSTSPRAAPPPSSPRSSTPTRQEELAERADDLARGSRDGRACWASARRLTDAGQGRLLEGPQGRVLAPDGDGRRRQADRLRRGHGRRPRPAARVLRAVPSRSSSAHGVAAACYGHADVGCLHIRPIINVKTRGRGRDAAGDRARGLRPGRRVRRRDERRARRRPGPQPLERQALRPRGLRRFEAVKRAFDPDEPDEPRQGRRRARPRRQPPDRPRLPSRTSPTPPSSTSRARVGSPAPSRCARASAPAARTARGTMCPSYMVTRDEEHTTRGRANALRLVMSGEPCPRDGLANETLARGARPLPPVQGVQERVPVERRHGQAQGRVPPPATTRAARCPLGSLLMGHIHRLNPIGSATAPLANWTLAPARRSSGSWRRPPGSTAGATLPTLRRRPPPQVVPHAPGRPPRRDARDGRPARRLLHHLQQPRGRPRGGAGAGGGGLPRRAGGAGLLRPAGDLEGAAYPRRATWRARMSRGSSTHRPRGACRSSAASRAAC